MTKIATKLKTMKRISVATTIITILILVVFMSFKKTNNLMMVPDGLTAIRIAEAIWLPIYGEKVLSEKPYNAILIGDSMWVVTGSLPKSSIITEVGDTTYSIFQGGVAMIAIRKRNCEILGVSHGK